MPLERTIAAAFLFILLGCAGDARHSPGARTFTSAQCGDLTGEMPELADTAISGVGAAAPGAAARSAQILVCLAADARLAWEASIGPGRVQTREQARVALAWFFSAMHSQMAVVATKSHPWTTDAFARRGMLLEQLARVASRSEIWLDAIRESAPLLPGIASCSETESVCLLRASLESYEVAVRMCGTVESQVEACELARKGAERLRSELPLGPDLRSRAPESAPAVTSSRGTAEVPHALPINWPTGP